MLKKVPHTYVIVFAIIVLAAIMTWFIPPGKYVKVEREVDGIHKSEMVFYYHNNLPNEYKSKAEPRMQTWQIFSALFKGFVKQSNIIIFILMIGGAFWIMNQSKAIDIGILAFLKFTKKIENNRLMRYLGVDNIIIVLLMVMFSIFEIGRAHV